MEFKRRVVKTLIEFHAVLDDENSLGDALHHFSEGFASRRDKIILRALGTLVNETDLASDKNKALKHFEMLIEAAIEGFEASVDGWINNRQRCPLASASINTGYTTFTEEIECRTKCTVEQFWDAHQLDLKTLIANRNAPTHRGNRGFAELYQAMDEAVADPASQKTKMKCMRSGDLIIGLEAPPQFTLVTFDRAFAAICSILGKPYQIIPSFQALRKMTSST